MPNLDDSRETERSSDVLAASDDYAARIAAVFEWRHARARTAPSSLHEHTPSSVLWMSRNTRRTDVTS